ncbi:MAG: hypothetical protein H0W12_10365 [Chitinophagaceae bacterium]|nr:hypothetical protein [Chitinophagaceae bacterium]
MKRFQEKATVILCSKHFLPLQMHDTYVFTFADTTKATHTYKYRGRQEALTFLDCGFGDKYIYSTPEDLLKWGQALYTNLLFSEQRLQEVFLPTAMKNQE